MDDIRVPMSVGSMDDIENEESSQNNSQTAESDIRIDYDLLEQELTEVS